VLLVATVAAGAELPPESAVGGTFLRWVGSVIGAAVLIGGAVVLGEALDDRRRAVAALAATAIATAGLVLVVVA
jgi:hypothetical protein